MFPPSGLNKIGSCHLFRHAAATLSLENGADIRFIQTMLGHESLDTTQIYIQVGIAKLAAEHAAIPPGAVLKRQHLVAALERESGEEDAD